MTEHELEHALTQERDLPPGHHAHYRELLMTHLARPDTDAAPAAPTPVTPLPRPVRPRMRLAVAATVAAALAIGIGAGYHRAAPGTAGNQEADPAQSATVDAGSSKDAAAVLDRIALAAATGPALTVRPDQWVYIKSETQYARPVQETPDAPWAMGPVTVREDWGAQSDQGVSMYRENGQDTEIHEIHDGGTPLPITNPTYAWALTLPTDPHLLLQDIYRDTAPMARKAGSKDAAAFEAIGNLLRQTILPPQTTAALYRATALIPGIQIVPDTVDAAGRHGVGIVRAQDNYGERQVWIFNKDTGAYLGQRAYLLHDNANLKAGTLTSISAVLDRAIVDHRGQTPTRTTPAT